METSSPETATREIEVMGERSSGWGPEMESRSSQKPTMAGQTSRDTTYPLHPQSAARSFFVFVLLSNYRISASFVRSLPAQLFLC